MDIKMVDGRNTKIGSFTELLVQYSTHDMKKEVTGLYDLVHDNSYNRSRSDIKVCEVASEF